MERRSVRVLKTCTFDLLKFANEKGLLSTSVCESAARNIRRSFQLLRCRVVPRAVVPMHQRGPFASLAPRMLFVLARRHPPKIRLPFCLWRFPTVGTLFSRRLRQVSLSGLGIATLFHALHQTFPPPERYSDVVS